MPFSSPQPEKLSAISGQQSADRRSRLADRSHQQSRHHRQQRQQNIPRPTYPDELPVVHRRAEIAAAIAAHQVVIICGGTGSGKSTQLPKICLEVGRGVAGMIGHTQPRRIAARTIAMRMATELHSQVGHAVGYKVRFNDRISRDSYIKVMTDGILLAETQRDRHLNQYDTIIIDEAHERSLNIDFLLGYLKQLLPKRPDLKVIITSATIDPQRFSQHFDDAPIIEVSGRTYPVELRYRPVQADEPDEEDPTVLEAILRAVDEIGGENQLGDAAMPQAAEDILIFLSGEREIREAAEALRKHHPPETEILPLFARLSLDEQNRVFLRKPDEKIGRRIVLATNVAETSLTVPGIRYVIDPGFARISRYSANARVQRLPIERISRASADQRQGRCGRIGPGVCIRLYSEDDYHQREPYTDPEILRANLANVILQMKFLNLGAVERFPFIDPPKPAMVREGYQTLLELGAITEPGERGRLTRIGVELAKLPVDPRIGRMILAARKEKCLREVLIIASALATQDPRLRPLEAQAEADAAHLPFVDESSDFFSYLKLWDFYHEQARHLSTNKLRKLCQAQYLSYVRLREWHDVHRQLRTLAAEGGMKINEAPAPPQAIHRALLAGLLNSIGSKTTTHEYLGPRERRFNIFPGSGLFKKLPKWIMAAELVETTRLYARTVARIHPEWIEHAGAHLIKRAHSDPHWNEDSAHVEAFERLTLHGLVIVPKRRIHYGPINPREAREIFIRQGLVEGALPARLKQAAFFAHNEQVLREGRTMEAKQRRRNAMATEEAAFNFFDRIIPPHVYDGPSFEKWRRRDEQNTPQLLFMSPSDLVRSEAWPITTYDPTQFPDFMSLDGVRVPLTYEFDPGTISDGVTATVPFEAVNQISERAVEWIVPGLLAEKVTELIRSLPKSLRREFVPAPDIAAAVTKSLQFGEGDLLDALATTLHRQFGVEVPREAWKLHHLPEYLRLNLRIIDARGQTIASGRDLTLIKRTLLIDSQRSEFGDQKLASRELKPRPKPPAAADRQRAGLGSEVNDQKADHADRRPLPSDLGMVSFTAWTFGDLEPHVELRRGPFTVRGYRALHDDRHSVSIRILDSQAAAAAAHRAGLRRLFALHVQSELQVHVDYLPNIDDLALLYAPLGSAEALKDDLVNLIVDRVFIGDSAAIFTQTEFERRVRSGWDRLWPITSETADLLERILTAHHTIELQLDEADRELWQPTIDDVRQQLAELFPPHVLTTIKYQWLEHYPRYLAAILARVRKVMAGHGARDARFTAELHAHWQRYEQLLERHRIHNIHDPELELYRWMIEEYRVSLFAQELGTRWPVSAKRLDTQWTKVQR